MALLTMPELVIAAREDIAEEDLPFAQYVIDSASLVVALAAGHSDWTVDDVPAEPRMIATQLAKRTYLNPDAVVQAGGLGPLGGDRTVEDFARTLELTPYELERLRTYEASGAAGTQTPGLWSQPITRGPIEKSLYLFDSSGSDWGIPYVDPRRDPEYFPVLD